MLRVDHRIRFLIATMILFILISISWVTIGPVYNIMLFSLLDPIAGNNVLIEPEGLNLVFSVSSWRVIANTGEVVNHAISMEIHSLLMVYGMVLAFVILLCLPGISVRNRIFLQAGVILLTLVTHIGGLLILLTTLESITLGDRSRQELETIERILTLAWLAIPSAVWLPALMRSKLLSGGVFRRGNQ